jgi:hypothetical protein
METGKMKQVTYIFAFIMLLATAGFAKTHPSEVATIAATEAVILSDVNLHTTFDKNIVQISWQATQQTKVRRYELEKSTDGENFFYITSFAGSEKTYTAEDKNLSSAIAYYRLKIMDADGQVFYSTVETINTKASADAIRILSTRLDANKLHIWLPANTSISSAVINGADGTIQRKAVFNESTNLAVVDISSMSAGVYHVTVKTNKGETLKLKFTRP